MLIVAAMYLSPLMNTHTGSNKAYEDTAVPYVLGNTAQNVNTILTNRSLNMAATGVHNKAGVVAMSQNPKAGSIVPKGTIVTVDFREPASTVE